MLFAVERRQPSPRTVFEQALEHTQETRDGFVTNACAGDSELERHVRRLLSSHSSAGDFIESPVLSTMRDAAPALIGTEVDGYRLTRLVGVGGMGEVYLGERQVGRYVIRVALKTVRWGLLSEEVSARFERERAILARLQHRSIARLRGAGTLSDGVPYLLMEFVDGTPLTDHCATHGLELADRLLLFLDVCVAVQHAHENGVLHRDLKPHNVLCDAHSGVTLLDFGIAKLLSPNEALELTRTGHRAFTPEYASPEQVLGKSPGVTTDVYSLGAMLYELVTGHPPFAGQLGSFAAVVETIVNQRPVPPSVSLREHGMGGDVTSPRLARPRNIVPEVRGDLDAIILKALSKTPSDRYNTVASLSSDVHRYLNGWAVEASPRTIDDALSRGRGRLRRRLTRWRRHGTGRSYEDLLRQALKQVRVALEESDRGRPNVSAGHLRSAARLQEDALLVQPRDRGLHRLRAFTKNRLGVALAMQGLQREASSAFLDAVSAWEIVAEREPDCVATRAGLAGNSRNAAVQLERLAQLCGDAAVAAESDRWFERAREELDISRRLGLLTPAGASVLSMLEQRVRVAAERHPADGRSDR